VVGVEMIMVSAVMMDEAWCVACCVSIVDGGWDLVVIAMPGYSRSGSDEDRGIPNVTKVLCVRNFLSHRVRSLL